jgi:hypothetical protein
MGTHVIALLGRPSYRYQGVVRSVPFFGALSVSAISLATAYAIINNGQNMKLNNDIPLGARTLWLNPHTSSLILECEIESLLPQQELSLCTPLGDLSKIDIVWQAKVITKLPPNATKVVSQDHLSTVRDALDILEKISMIAEQFQEPSHVLINVDQELDIHYMDGLEKISNNIKTYNTRDELFKDLQQLTTACGKFTSGEETIFFSFYQEGSQGIIRNLRNKGLITLLSPDKGFHMEIYNKEELSAWKSHLKWRRLQVQNKKKKKKAILVLNAGGTFSSVPLESNESKSS